MKKLYATATGVSDIISIRFTEAHNDAAPIITVKCLTATIDIGDLMVVDMGYESDHAQIFRGYVKSITKTTTPTEIEITAYGTMIRAVDFFLASTNPDDPFTRRNIEAEFLVRDLMKEAGLNSFGYDSPHFIFSTKSDLEVNLVSVYDYCNMISNTLAWHLYADKAGKVWFVERRPYIMSGDTSSTTVNDNQHIISFQYSVSERDLRNRVVVYGRGDIHAESKSATSYDPIDEVFEQVLPSDFYKTVVASADWIDTLSMAQRACSFNLDLLNRLTVEASLVIEGNPNIEARDVITVDSDVFSLNTDFYVYTVDHNWNVSGFTTSLTLRK